MRATCRIRWRLRDGTVRETDGYGALNLLGHAEVFGIRMPQACGGQAECGTCRVELLSGALTPCRGEEAELMAGHRKRFLTAERLACQARPIGDVEIALPRRRPPDLREAVREGEDG